jgi:hypothetical protein
MAARAEPLGGGDDDVLSRRFATRVPRARAWDLTHLRARVPVLDSGAPVHGQASRIHRGGSLDPSAPKDGGQGSYAARLAKKYGFDVAQAMTNR